MSPKARKLVLGKAHHLSREVPRLLHRHRRRIGSEALWKLADTTRSLRAALAAPDPDAALVEAHSEALERLVDLHLNHARGGEWWEYAETLIAALLIALFIRTFLFEAFKIPSGSMIPTLMVDDRIFVSKFVYGIKLPYTEVRLFDWRAPARGEVIVFVYPGPGLEHGKDFIKRVIAVAGDRVRLENNLWFVNQDVPDGTRVIARRAECKLSPDEVCEWRPLVPPPGRRVGAQLRALTQAGCPCTFLEESNGDFTWVAQHVASDALCDCESPEERQPDTANSPDWPRAEDIGEFIDGWGPAEVAARMQHRDLPDGRIEMEVPDGYVFVAGDNRDNSKDGRYWGLVPLENVKGKALLIWGAGENWTDRVLRMVH